MNEIRKRMGGLIVLCFAAAACFLNGCTLGDGVEQRTLRVSNYGHTTGRVAVLEGAVERFNAAHPKIHYTIEPNYYTDGVWDWDNYNDMTEQILEEKGVSDILTIPGEHVGKFAAKGYLLPLDDVIEDPRFQEEYFAPLVPKTNFLGHTWGLLVEMDLRVAYLNREIFSKLGYTEAEIEAMPEQIRTGELILKDLEEIGAEAVEKGLADFAVVHRPRYGSFFYGMAQEYDAFSIDETGQVYFNEENFTEMLRFYQRNVERNREPQPLNWSEANDIFIQGRAAVYLGANWTIYDCVKERGGDEEILLNQYVAALLPAVQEGGSPFNIANTMQIAISANCEYPEDVKKILADAYSDWETLADHCVEAYRLPVAKSIAASQTFSENEFLSSLMYMTDYTYFMPYMEDTRRWLNALYQAVCSVENGSGSPEEVARTFALDMEEELAE